MFDRPITSYQPTAYSPEPSRMGTSPKTVTKTPVSTPTPDLTRLPHSLAEQIRESPLLNIQALTAASPQISWKTAVVLSVTLFFLGAFLAVVVMLMLY